MKKFDVGYLSFDSLQEGVGTSQILRLLEEHTKNGLSVSVVTFEKKKPPIWLTERVRKANIEWAVIEFGGFGRFAALERIRQIAKVIPNSSVLHGRSDLATFSAIRFGEAPVLWDIRSLWQAQRRIMNPHQIGKSTSKILDRIELNNARKSDGFSTLSKAVIPILKEKYKTLPVHSRVIPTCVDLELFQWKPPVSPQKMVLVSGSFNKLYDFDMTHKVLSALKQKLDMSIVWARGVDSSARVFGLGERIIEEIPHHEMPSWVSAAAVGIALCKTGDDSLKGAMPTKIAEFLSCGRPVIISKGVGDLDEILSRNRVGITISEEDDFNVKLQELAELLADSETANRCRNTAEELFSIAEAAKSYAELYQEIS